MDIAIHGGLPKTGTSTMQTWMHRNADKLLQQGVIYPRLSGGCGHVAIAKQMRLDSLPDTLPKAYSRLAAKRVVFSCEGLTAHWFRFSDGAKDQLKAWGEYFDKRELFIVHRDVEKWRISLYKQILINPYGDDDYAFGTGISYAEFCRLPVIISLSDFKSVGEDIARIIGFDLHFIDYEKASVSEMIQAVSAQSDCLPDQEARFNKSISNSQAELIRRVNEVCITHGFQSYSILSKFADQLADGNLILQDSLKRDFKAVFVPNLFDLVRNVMPQAESAFGFDENIVQSMIETLKDDCLEEQAGS